MSSIWRGRKKFKKIFWPSSIAVFGSSTPKESTPQATVMEPITVYGIIKQVGERWCEYFFKKCDVDVRNIRYLGLINYKTLLVEELQIMPLRFLCSGKGQEIYFFSYRNNKIAYDVYGGCNPGNNITYVRSGGKADNTVVL